MAVPMQDTDDFETEISSRLIALVLTIDEPGGSRRQSAESELGKAGLHGEFVQGYMKGDPSASQEYSEIKNLFLSKRGLTTGEIAVYAGHRRLWRRFLQSDYDYAMILEDDFRIIDMAAFQTAIIDCLSHPNAWGMVKYFDFKPKRIISQQKIGSTELVRYKYAASGAVCYLLNRAATERLLSRARFFRPVDEDFSWDWDLARSIWSVSPNPVSEAADELGGSLLEADRNTNKLNRNALRSVWYNFVQAYKQIRSLFNNIS